MKYLTFFSVTKQGFELIRTEPSNPLRSIFAIECNLLTPKISKTCTLVNSRSVVLFCGTSLPQASCMGSIYLVKLFTVHSINRVLSINAAVSEAFFLKQNSRAMKQETSMPTTAQCYYISFA